MIKMIKNNFLHLAVHARKHCYSVIHAQIKKTFQVTLSKDP